MEQKTYTYNKNNSYIFKIVCNNENEKRQIEFNKKRQIEFNKKRQIEFNKKRQIQLNEELQFEFDEKYLNNIRK